MVCEMWGNGKKQKDSIRFLIIYLLAEMLRIGFLLVGSVVFKLSVNEIGAGSDLPVPQVYYLLGETLRPIATGVSIASGVFLILFALYMLLQKKINYHIFKKMLVINSFIVILTLYLLYIAASLFGITPAIYNYCTYNLSSIFIVLMLHGGSVIIERCSKTKGDM